MSSKFRKKDLKDYSMGKMSQKLNESGHFVGKYLNEQEVLGNIMSYP